MYNSIFKRLIDITFSSILLLLTSPVILIITIVLAIDYKGTPFFKQLRPGYKEKGFHVYKFKSMNDKKGEDGELLPDNQRLTKVGGFVRKTSLDELPQFFNVLKGDMSLIGPRPLLFKYIPLYSAEQKRRHDVRPGISGLAQVMGRNSISWTEKFKYDIEYVDNISLIMDIRIMLLTVKKVLIREGVNQSENRPMNPFNGKN